MEFASHKSDEAAHIAGERAFLQHKFEGAKVTGPYQVIDGGCGSSSGRRYVQLIPQRVYLVETPFKAFPVGVCRRRSQPGGYVADENAVIP
jgi:hypothetical protein